MLEKVPDRASDSLFDKRVGIGKTPSQTLGQLPADSGLSTTGHADERQRFRTGTTRLENRMGFDQLPEPEAAVTVTVATRRRSSITVTVISRQPVANTANC